MGKLGASGTDFDQWSDLVEVLFQSKYPLGEELLKWARQRNDQPITEEDLQEVAKTMSIDLDDMRQWSTDLYGLLAQQTSGAVRRGLKTCKGKGLEAWRRVHYTCSPKSTGAAEQLRAELVRDRPSKTPQELTAALDNMDSLFDRYDMCSAVTLS